MFASDKINIFEANHFEQVVVTFKVSTPSCTGQSLVSVMRPAACPQFPHGPARCANLRSYTNNYSIVNYI